MQARKKKRAETLEINEQELGRMSEGVLVEMLVVLYKMRFPNKAKIETIAKEAFDCSVPHLRDAIAGKTHLGLENLLKAESVCETNLVSRFFKSKGGKI